MWKNWELSKKSISVFLKSESENGKRSSVLVSTFVFAEDCTQFWRRENADDTETEPFPRVAPGGGRRSFNAAIIKFRSMLNQSREINPKERPVVLFITGGQTRSDD